MSGNYQNPGPTREQVDASTGVMLLEFGTSWCGYCQGAAPHVADALRKYPGIEHLQVEDGPGRPLGRSYRVKLWPTLIGIKDGTEVARVVRPEDAEQVRKLLEQITAEA